MKIKNKHDTDNRIQSEQYSEDEKDVLRGLPLIEKIGHEDPSSPDRSLGFPHTLYHSSKSEEFSLNDKLNHRTSPVHTGDRTGRGLYLASEKISKMFGSHKPIEFIPHNATLIDLSSPDIARPLTDDFKKAYLEDYAKNARSRIESYFPGVDTSYIESLYADFDKRAAEGTKDGYITLQDIATLYKELDSTLPGLSFEQKTELSNANKEIAAQHNSVQIMKNIESLSLDNIFRLHDGKLGIKIDGQLVHIAIAPILDFLTDRGIDGAITAQKFKNGNGEEENGVVFWKLDNIGDEATWKRRRDQTVSLGTRVLSRTIMHTATK